MERKGGELPYLIELHQEIRKYSIFGYKVIRDGTERISHFDWIGNLAWGFKIFSPINKFELNELVSSLSIPVEYLSFLSINNGLKLFYNSISLAGYQNLSSSSRDMNDQPVDLRLYNIMQRSPLLSDGFFCLGVYGFDVSEIYMCLNTGEIVVANRRRAPMEILSRWPNFQNFLITEFYRLQKLADERGYIKDMSLTLPRRS